MFLPIDYYLPLKNFGNVILPYFTNSKVTSLLVGLIQGIKTVRGEKAILI